MSIKSCEWNWGENLLKPIKMILLCFLNCCCCIYVSLGPNNKYFSLTDEISTHGTFAKGKKKKKNRSKTNKRNLFSTLPYLPYQTNFFKIDFSYMKL